MKKSKTKNSKIKSLEENTNQGYNFKFSNQNIDLSKLTDNLDSDHILNMMKTVRGLNGYDIDYGSLRDVIYNNPELRDVYLSKILDTFIKADLKSYSEQLIRANSLTVGRNGGGVEVILRSDTNPLFYVMSNLEAIELIHQLAALVGCHIAIRPRNDFASQERHEYKDITQDDVNSWLLALGQNINNNLLINKNQTNE